MTTNGVFKIIKVSKDRIGAIVGKKGAVKDEIESKCNVLLDIDGENGDITIKMRGNESLIDSGVFKASEIVLAISKGFSPERSYRLLSDECILQLLDLREYSGKSSGTSFGSGLGSILLKGESLNTDSLYSSWIVFSSCGCIVQSLSPQRSFASGLGLPQIGQKFTLHPFPFESPPANM